MKPSSSIGVVAIGRNEGERFLACLKSFEGSAADLVYVDSGSTDGSVAAADAAGARVVQLDMSQPFSASRARNAGFLVLNNAETPPEFVQFIDGDCQVQPGWLNAAQETLLEQSDLGVVTGILSEKEPERSVYNAMCDYEWHGPIGEIEACGGLTMVRREAFRAVGGYDEALIAGEDDDFCVRMRQAGWKIRRIPVDMALHDAAMTRISQWWTRMERAGHAFAQLGRIHPGVFRKQLLRIWTFGAVLPLLFVTALLLGNTWLAMVVCGLYGLSWWRSARRLHKEGLPRSEARKHAGFLVLSKFAGLLGVLRFHRRRLSGGAMQLIEYK